MSQLIEINTENAFTAHLATLLPSALVVVYFYTPRTAYKTQMSTELPALISVCPPTVSAISINAKILPGVAKLYEIRTAPSVALLRNGELLEAIQGSRVSTVRDAINRFVSIPAVPSPPTKQPIVIDEDLYNRLAILVKAAPVMVFMKGTPSSPYCRFSRRLVDLLHQNQIKFGSYNIFDDEKVRESLKTFADWPTYPQLWVEGELIGGLEIIKEEFIMNPTFMEKYKISEKDLSQND